VKSIYLKYGILAISLFAMVGVSGCSSSSDEANATSGTEEATTANGAKLILSVSKPASSRATGDELNSTSAEQTISSLMIYFTDAAGNIQYVIDDYYSTPSDNIIVDLGKKGITTGSFNIYVCANITDALKTSLTVGTNLLSTIGTISDISVITQSNKFLMFGEANVSSSNSFEIIEGNTIVGTVSLDRVMSKVLVTGTVDANNSITGTYAFVNLSDIHFTLQTTAKRFYCMPQYVDPSATTKVVKDPDYNMSDLLTSTFAYKTGADSYFGDLTPYDYGTNGSWLAAEAYDVAKTAGDGYTSGLYCLENTTSAVPADFSLTTSQAVSVPMKVTTYLRIAIKSIPRIIDGTSYNTSAEALAKLTESASDGGKKFYTYLGASDEAGRQKAYSTINAVKAQFGSSYDSSNLVEHSTATVYTYNVFVNGKTFDATNSSLIRNHYYIVDITDISTPFYDKVMEINTKANPWTDAGIGSYDVDTSGQTSKQ
jgi:hypothetical protein